MFDNCKLFVVQCVYKEKIEKAGDMRGRQKIDSFCKKIQIRHHDYYFGKGIY